MFITSALIMIMSSVKIPAIILVNNNNIIVCANIFN